MMNWLICSIYSILPQTLLQSIIMIAALWHSLKFVGLWQLVDHSSFMFIQCKMEIIMACRAKDLAPMIISSSDPRYWN